jgi:hypothetical protein
VVVAWPACGFPPAPASLPPTCPGERTGMGMSHFPQRGHRLGLGTRGFHSWPHFEHFILYPSLRISKAFVAIVA